MPLVRTSSICEGLRTFPVVATIRSSYREPGSSPLMFFQFDITSSVDRSHSAASKSSYNNAQFLNVK